ncbi:hypothetical protein RvY_02905 [Ramazzottius varieornatus]|uniref:Uncharacterized protein n=1 Tax=Ramazzottius varieornatus TaxID=947166 RepID=A0A1D1UL95_RAMVA|nr:hypothetical protein RvY_02905 [Ramazzottius varieornatus]
MRPDFDEVRNNKDVSSENWRTRGLPWPARKVKVTRPQRGGSRQDLEVKFFRFFLAERSRVRGTDGRVTPACGGLSSRVFRLLGQVQSKDGH